MNVYVLPLANLFMTFIALYLCVKFVFSRQGFFRLLPTIFSLLLSAYFLNELLEPAAIRENLFAIPFYSSLLSGLWLCVVIQFRYTIKKSVKSNRYEDERRKNYTEAKFIEKSERRSFLRFEAKRRSESIYSAYVPVLYQKNINNVLPSD